MLRLDDLWVWDSWVADDGDLYHLFFLQAPRALEDPGKRHTAATVGHATSPDLVDWTYLGETFGPGPQRCQRFDDLAIWTGSVVHDGEQWRMFYTAVSNAGHHIYDQRVGVGGLRRPAALGARRLGAGRAPSTAAGTRTSPTPRPPPRARTSRGPARPGATRWSSPTRTATAGTCSSRARARDAARNDDGVVAHATSPDLETWTLGPPLCEPGAGFGQLEVLQNKEIDGRWVLVFTCHPQEMTAERIARTGDYCTWSVPGPGPLGSVGHRRRPPVHAASRTSSPRLWCSSATGRGC